MSKDCFEIITNYYCDLKCKFCSQIMNGYKPDKKLILNEIYIAKKERFKRIGFSGGESTLRDDLPFIIKMAAKVGFKFIRLQTNGYRLSDTNYANKLIDSGLTYCKFTFLSHNKSINDYLVGKKNAFDMSFKGMKNLSRKIGVGVNILLNSYNFIKIDKTVKFFLDQGISDFVIIYPIYISNMFGNKDKIGVSIKKAKDSVMRVLDMCYSYGILSGIKVLNMPPCSLGKYAKRSSDYYRFNTVICEPGLKRFDLDNETQKNKIKRDKCKKCIYFNKCFGVDKNYIDIFGWYGFEPVLKDSKLSENENLQNKFYFTSSERCIIEILKIGGEMKTFNIIEKSKKHILCIGCKDGLNVLNTLNSLYKKGIVIKKFYSGSYIWKLL